MLYDGVVDDDDDDVDDDTSLPTTPCWRHGELLAVLPDVRFNIFRVVLLCGDEIVGVLRNGNSRWRMNRDWELSGRFLALKLSSLWKQRYQLFSLPPSEHCEQLRGEQMLITIWNCCCCRSGSVMGTLVLYL